MNGLVDFKPKSLNSESQSAFIAFDQSDGVQVIVPTENTVTVSYTNTDPVEDDNRDTSHMLFKGSKKIIKGDKECILTFDKTMNTMKLERISSNVVVKNTRGEQLDEAIQIQMKRLRQETPEESSQEMLGENPEFSLLDNFTAKNAQVSEKTRKEAAPPTKSTHSHSAVTFSSSKSTQQYEVPIKKLKMDISKPAVPSPTIIKQKSTAPSKPIPVTSSPSNLLFSKEENSGETTRNVENMKNAAPTNSLKSILQMDLQLSESSSDDEAGDDNEGKKEDISSSSEDQDSDSDEDEK